MIGEQMLNKQNSFALVQMPSSAVEKAAPGSGTRQD
jgi:hypothetical protein